MPAAVAAVAAVNAPEVARRAARVILVDDDERLVLVRRVRTDLPEQGCPVYWTTAGGGIEPGETREEAAVREAEEELGARVRLGPQVLMTAWYLHGGLRVNHFFLARLVDLDPARRSGPELDVEFRGTLEADARGIDEVAGLDLRPSDLREHVVTHWPALLAEAALI